MESFPDNPLTDGLSPYVGQVLILSGWDASEGPIHLSSKPRVFREAILAIVLVSASHP